MPYIGNTIRAADDYRLIDDISSSFNGSTTSFALQVAGSAPVPFPKSPQQVLISVNGVIQEPDPTGASGFNLVGTNIVFSSAPTNGHAFFGIIYATADYLNAGGNFPSGSLGAPSFTFIGDENTGLYRKSGGSVGFVSDATEIANFDSNGITISSGSLIITDSIIHSGDANTKIRFPDTDEISFETGGAERFKITDSESVFNDGSSNYDFRVEGGTEANLLFIDGSADKIGISTSSPEDLVHIKDGKIRIENSVVSNNDSVVSYDDTTFLVDVDPNNVRGSSAFQVKIDTVIGLTVNDGRDVGISTTSPSDKLDVAIDTDGEGITISSANLKPMFTGNSNRAAENNTIVGFRGKWNGTEVGRIAVEAGSDTTNKDDGSLTFFTRTSGSGLTKRLSIEENGDVLPGVDSTYDIGSNSNRFANGYFDTLYGDGSNLTGVSGTTINNNANNRLITGSGTANTLEGESNLTFDGTSLLIGHTSSEHSDGFQIELSDTGSDSSIALTSIQNNIYASQLSFVKARGSSLGARTIVQDGDMLGELNYYGADGTNRSLGAQIIVHVDGTPGNDVMPSQIKFKSSPAGSQTPTDRLRLRASGDVQIPNGNLVIQTSGKGIDFSATGGPDAGSGSSTSEILDDYERGTFAAEIVQGLGSLSNTFDNSATYEKVGNLVHIQALIQFGGVGNGTAVFLRLPYTHITDTSLGGGVISFTNVSGLTGESCLTLVGQSGQSYCRIKNKTTDPSISGTQNNQAIYYHFTYHTS